MEILISLLSSISLYLLFSFAYLGTYIFFFDTRKGAFCPPSALALPSICPRKEPYASALSPNLLCPFTRPTPETLYLCPEKRPTPQSGPHILLARLARKLLALCAGTCFPSSFHFNYETTFYTPLGTYFQSSAGQRWEELTKL